MKQKISLFLLFAFYFEVFAHNRVSIIPYPQQVEIQQWFFTFDKCTSLSFDRKNKVLQSAVKPLVEKFKTVSSFDLLNPICRNAPAIQIVLDSKMPEEGYQLSISNKKVLIKFHV